ncbi:hypothetical protein [Arthrobacter sp. HLT1-21]
MEAIHRLNEVNATHAERLPRRAIRDVRFEAAGTDDEAAIEAAYENKYPDSSAAQVMRGPRPKAASFRISQR